MAIQRHWLPIRIWLGASRWLCGFHKAARGMESDCEALTIDAPTWLSSESVTFHSLGMRIYLVWLLPAVLGCAVVKWEIIDRARSAAGLNVGWSFITVGVLAYLICPAYLIKRRICLDSDGFRILRRSGSTFVPWRVLLCSRDWNEEFFQLRIPVRSSVRDEITTTVNCITRSVAAGANPDAIRIVADSEICLTWSFQLDPRLFIDIAKQMAYSATAAVPLLSKASELIPIDDHSRLDAAGVKLLGNGGLQIPISAITFPSVCCRCGTDTTSLFDVDVATRHFWWMPSRASASIEIPVCSSCIQASWMRYLATIVLIEAAWTLAICGLIFGEFPVFGKPENTATFYAMVLILGIFPTRWILSFQCLFWRVASIVKNIGTNEFRFRFADDGYRDRMLQVIMRHSVSYDAGSHTMA